MHWGGTLSPSSVPGPGWWQPELGVGTSAEMQLKPLLPLSAQCSLMLSMQCESGPAVVLEVWNLMMFHGTGIDSSERGSRVESRKRVHVRMQHQDVAFSDRAHFDSGAIKPMQHTMPFGTNQVCFPTVSPSARCNCPSLTT